MVSKWLPKVFKCSLPIIVVKAQYLHFLRDGNQKIMNEHDSPFSFKYNTKIKHEKSWDFKEFFDKH